MARFFFAYERRRAGGAALRGPGRLRRCRAAPADRRVHAIAFSHDGARWIARVGEELSGRRTTQQLRRGELIERTEHLASSSRVLAIYPGAPYVVVTDAQPITGAPSEWANPFTAEPDSVTFFGLTS